MKSIIGFLIVTLSISVVHSAIITSMLIGEGLKLAAPFGETAMSRLHLDTFGNGRAARSTDVIIFNQSDKDFEMEKTGCEAGGWSANMFPEQVLRKHTSTVFGMQSAGFMTGVECMVKYSSKDGAYFTVNVDNPYWGKNQISSSSSSSLKAVGTNGKGVNNQVRWILRNFRSSGKQEPPSKVEQQESKSNLHQQKSQSKPGVLESMFNSLSSGCFSIFCKSMWSGRK